MADANPNKTPLPAGADVLLVKYDGEASSLDVKHYQASLAASSMYRLAHTQIFLLLCCALHNIQQTPHHNIYALRNISCPNLLGTVDACLCYDGVNGDGLHGYSDSSMGDHTDDRHSTRLCILLGNGAISWSSRKQRTIAQSTSEAEYMAMTDAANQAVWYRAPCRAWLHCG